MSCHYEGYCTCTSGHTGWDGEHATYEDIDGVKRCRQCGKEVDGE